MEPIKVDELMNEIVEQMPKDDKHCIFYIRGFKDGDDFHHIALGSGTMGNISTALTIHCYKNPKFADMVKSIADHLEQEDDIAKDEIDNLLGDIE